MKPMPIWYLAGALAAIAVGWLTATLNVAGIAPIAILSLAVGALLGAILGGIAALTQVTCRKQLIVGTIALAILTVLAEHAWLYRDFRRQWHEARANSAEVAMFRSETPWSPGEYFGRELSSWRAVYWCVDAMLVVSAAIVTVLVWPKFLTPTAGTRVASDAAKLKSPTPDP
jgi:hypothetical protein